MLYVIILLTALFAISFAIYQTAKTESVGFKALVAWIVFAGLDLAALLGWLFWSYFQGAAT
jgi:hypothetical protein